MGVVLFAYWGWLTTVRNNSFLAIVTGRNAAIFRGRQQLPPIMQIKIVLPGRTLKAQASALKVLLTVAQRLTSAFLPTFLSASGLCRAFPFSVAVSITRAGTFGAFSIFFWHVSHLLSSPFAWFWIVLWPFIGSRSFGTQFPVVESIPHYRLTPNISSAAPVIRSTGCLHLLSP